MPREYRTGSGPAAPSPSGFGSADINLQTPRFVAQTNVAQPENPFAVLQKVLGLGAEIGSQMLKMQTAEIEQKINIERAIEIKKEREENRKEREEAKARRLADEEAKKIQADYAVRLAKAETPEEAEAIRKEAVGLAGGASSTENKLVYASAAERAEAQRRERETAQDKILFDNTLEITSMGSVAIEAAVENGNIENLDTLRVGYAKRAKEASDPRTKAAYTDLWKTVNNEMEKLQDKSEQDLNKQTNNAARQAASAVDQSVSPLIDKIKSNFESYASDFSNIGDDSVRGALFDMAREELLNKNPGIAGAILSGSEAEQNAITEQIDKMITPVVDAISSYRNTENGRQAFEASIGDIAIRAQTDPLDSVISSIDSNVRWTQDQKSRAYKAAADSYVDGGATFVDKLKRASELVMGDNTTMASRAGSQLNKMILGRTSAFALERRKIIERTPSTGDMAASGWNTVYNTKDELIDYVLSTFGTNRAAFEDDPIAQRTLGPLVTKIADEYDSDVRKFEAQQSRETIAARRMSPNGRKTIKVEEGWKVSPLGMAIEDGSYTKLSKDELEPMLIDSLFGFENSAVPTPLAKAVLDGVDSPQNYNLIEAFWGVMQRAQDPTIRNQMISNDKYKESFAVGAALRYLRRNKEIGSEETVGVMTEFVTNMKAWSKPQANTEEDKAFREQYQAALSELASDATFNTGWADTGEVNIGDVSKRMSPADMTIGLEYAVLAANFPNSVDRSGLMRDMMRQDGYGVYRVQRDGATNLRMFRNVPGFNGQIPLPTPEALDSDEFKRYMGSMKDQVASALSKMPQLDSGGVQRTYNASEIQEVELDPYDQDLLQGYSAIRAKVAGRWIHIPTDKIKTTAQSFYEYTSTVLPVEREKEQKDKMQRLSQRVK